MKSSFRAPSNIALVKYWGKYGVQLPSNPSISFTLDACATETTLELTDAPGITVALDGVDTPSFVPKVAQFVTELTHGTLGLKTTGSGCRPTTRFRIPLGLPVVRQE